MSHFRWVSQTGTEVKSISKGLTQSQAFRNLPIPGTVVAINNRCLQSRCRMVSKRAILCMVVSLIAVGVGIGVLLLLLNKSDAQTPVDIRTLAESSSDLDKFLGKLGRLQESGRYVEIGRMHGDDRYQCPHEKPTFLAWHRAYLIWMENELGYMWPYWDWTEEIHIPIIDSPTYKGQRNPLNTGYMYDSAQGGEMRNVLTTRQWQDLSASYLSEYVYRALTRADFGEFQRELEAVHAIVHNSIGGTMVPVKTAAFDPIFWLHHSFVNVVFSMWLSLYPNADLSAFNDQVVEGYDTQGSSTTFRAACARNVKFPFNDVFRRAASAVKGGVGTGMQFQTMEAGIPDHKHLIVILHNVTSPMDSQTIRVQFDGKPAGFMGMIGMVHRDMMNMGRLEYDRFIDVTQAYFQVCTGLNLDQVREITAIEVENLSSGKKEPYQGPWTLQWEVY